MNEIRENFTTKLVKNTVMLFKSLYSSNSMNAVKNEVDFALFVENLS